MKSTSSTGRVIRVLLVTVTYLVLGPIGMLITLRIFSPDQSRAWLMVGLVLIEEATRGVAALWRLDRQWQFALLAAGQTLAERWELFAHPPHFTTLQWLASPLSFFLPTVAFLCDWNLWTLAWRRPRWWGPLVGLVVGFHSLNNLLAGNVIDLGSQWTSLLVLSLLTLVYALATHTAFRQLRVSLATHQTIAA